VAFDVELATGSVRVRDAVLALAPGGLDDAAFAGLERELLALERGFTQRSALLKGG
jgi:hypothetical protein